LAIDPNALLWPPAAPTASNIALTLRALRALALRDMPLLGVWAGRLIRQEPGALYSLAVITGSGTS